MFQLRFVCSYLDSSPREERLVRKIGVWVDVSLGLSQPVKSKHTMLLEVLSAGGDELDGGKLVPPLLKTRDDGTNKPTLDAYERRLSASGFRHIKWMKTYRQA